MLDLNPKNENKVMTKSIIPFIILTSMFLSCQNISTTGEIKTTCHEIKISVFDKSLLKTMPFAKLELGNFEIALKDFKDTTVCLEIGKQLLRIKSIETDSVYLERELSIHKNKDLLWIKFYNPSSKNVFQRHFAYWKLINTLKKIEPSKSYVLQKKKLQLFREGQIIDSIISHNQNLYDEIFKETCENNFVPESDTSEFSGFSILYHQTMIL